MSPGQTRVHGAARSVPGRGLRILGYAQHVRIQLTEGDEVARYRYKRLHTAVLSYMRAGALFEQTARWAGLTHDQLRECLREMWT